MHTIAVVSQKGGAGKTTLACAIAVDTVRRGLETVLVDLDPQGSASGWHDLRKADTPVCVRTNEERLTRVLQAARESGADLAILDTAPVVDTAARRAARAADLVLIPCRPAAADLSAIGASIEIARRARTRAVVVLNSAPVANPLVDQARAAIARYDVACAPVVIHQRIDHVHAWTTGQSACEAAPTGKAAAELGAFANWLHGDLDRGQA